MHVCTRVRRRGERNRWTQGSSHREAHGCSAQPCCCSRRSYSGALAAIRRASRTPKTTPSDPQSPVTEGDAAGLWATFEEGSYRTQWDRAPGYEDRKPAAGPHGDAVEIFVNSNVADTLSTPGSMEWPDGSIIVKDVYRSDALEYVAVMQKRGDSWFWAGVPTGRNDRRRGPRDPVLRELSQRWRLRLRARLLTTLSRSPSATVHQTDAPRPRRTRRANSRMSKPATTPVPSRYPPTWRMRPGR